MMWTPLVYVFNVVWQHRYRFLLISLYFTALLTVGTVGYGLIEGWNVFDGFYMTSITVSSVGFSEIHPLSNNGRLWTLFLLGGGLLGLGFFWAAVTALLVESDLQGAMGRWRMARMMDLLSQHVVVCGAGRMGMVVVQQVLAQGQKVVVIDHNPEKLKAIKLKHPEVMVVHGDATQEAVLCDAKIAKAHALAACLNADAENLLLCLTVSGLAPHVHVVARVQNEESLEKFKRAGVKDAVSPIITGGMHMAGLVMGA